MIQSDAWEKLFQGIKFCKEHKFYTKQYGEIIKLAANSESNSWKSTEKKLKGSALGRFMEDDENSNKNKNNRVFALDCEMVLCKSKACTNEMVPGVSTLARVSLVECCFSSDTSKNLSPSFKTILDIYTKISDDLVVVDYLTHVSGIEKHHLESDTCLSFSDTQQKLLDTIQVDDIIFGHSLWSDFRALKIWHANIIDSAFFYEIEGLPNMTLGLKDIAVETFSGSDEKKKLLMDFQKAGDSHDSVIDAEWTARVICCILDANLPYPISVGKIPDRLLCRLTANLIPFGCTESMLHNILTNSLQRAHKTGSSIENTFLSNVANDEALFRINPIKWKIRKDGSTVGTSVIDFQNPELAFRTFMSLEVATTGCGGSFQSKPCHPSGWPGRYNSFMRKLVLIPSEETAAKSCKAETQDGFQTVTGKKRRLSNGTPMEGVLGSCEIISYIMASLSVKKIHSCNRKVLGRVIGPFGRRMLMVEQCTGTRISLTQTKRQGTFQIESDTLDKVKAAITMLQKSAAGEYSYVK